MEAAGLGLGIVATVVELYKVIEGAYALYLEVKHFRSTYHELYLCMEIERWRFKLWGRHVLSESHQEEAKSSPSELKLFELFESILQNVRRTFSDASDVMETYSEQALSERKNGRHDSPGSGNDRVNELSIDDITISPRPQKRSAIPNLLKTVKFVLKDEDKLEKLVKKLSKWNDSLDKMTSRLDQESARRQLRTRFSTNDSEQLQRLELAAALLQHRDIESMASTRSLIEEGRRKESCDEEGFKILRAPSSYHLEIEDLSYEGNPYKTETNRATAIYRGESVIIDWRACRDDTWRKENPGEFRLRTENLAKVLNSDLQPLNLSVLHCVGYLDRSTHVTGYAFRPPQDSKPGQKPVSLHEVLAKSTKAKDIADLGERFKLAQALVSTIFEIHNLGWLHKNLHPKNILFWPKSSTEKDPNLDKPYIVGFDVARLNRPDEMSEKPQTGMEEELYRHPEYKGENPKSFLPSYDFYSLGVILFEIGMWRTVASQGRHGRSQLRPPSPYRSASPVPHSSDIIDPRYVEEVVMHGPVMDLKRYMGSRYRDAVVACLNKDLDSLWEDENADPSEQLPVYLGAVQSQILDPIAQCNA
ncbi:hypothetical protein ACLMJK_008479 [Lecanora helva]